MFQKAPHWRLNSYGSNAIDECFPVLEIDYEGIKRGKLNFADCRRRHRNADSLEHLAA